MKKHSIFNGHTRSLNIFSPEYPKVSSTIKQQPKLDQMSAKKIPLIVGLLLVLSMITKAHNNYEEISGSTTENSSSIKINSPDSVFSFNAECNEKSRIHLKHKKKTNIAVIIDVTHLDEDATLALHINERVESTNWQAGKSYVFKTTDNSGFAWIEFITQPCDIGTGSSSIQVSYYPLENGEFRTFDDEITYVETVILDQKSKYINQPLSVLFQDFSAYDIPIVSFIAKRSTLDLTFDYNKITLSSKRLDEQLFDNERDYRWAVLLDQAYDYGEVSEIRVKYLNNEDGTDEWNNEFKQYLSTKVVSDVYIYEIQK